jgi:hypothetical protein
MTHFVTWETLECEPVTAGQRTLKPQAQALRVKWPNGGFVWNRPTGVTVEEAGQSEFFAITDPTRTAVLALWTVAALAMIMAFLAEFRGQFSR